jgi:hypothetical protein
MLSSAFLTNIKFKFYYEFIGELLYVITYLIIMTVKWEYFVYSRDFIVVIKFVAPFVLYYDSDLFLLFHAVRKYYFPGR